MTSVAFGIFFELFGGRYYISVCENHMTVNWIIEIEYLLDEMFPNAEKSILIMGELALIKLLIYRKYFCRKQGEKLK